MLNWIRGAIYGLFVAALTTVMILGCLPALIMPWRVGMACQRAWARAQIFVVRWLCGVKVEVRGLENIQPGTAIYASKHQSMWETVYLQILLKDAAVVMKKELLSMPFYGWHARRIGMIPIDRKGRAAALREMLRAAEVAKTEDRPILIFPEGTRIPVGERGPFHAAGIGAFYKHLNLPVVPIVHNSALHYTPSRLPKVPGTIILEILPPIQPGLDRKAFMAELEETVNTHTERLLVEQHGESAEKAVDEAAQ